MPMELRRVRPYRKFNPDRGFLWCLLIILFQTPSNFTGLHPNDGVVSGGVIRRATKDRHPDGPLLQILDSAIQFLGDDISKKLFSSGAMPELPALQNPFEFLEHKRATLLWSLFLERFDRMIQDFPISAHGHFSSGNILPSHSQKNLGSGKHFPREFPMRHWLPADDA
ncbi:MAG TPA: hypothetical protein DGA22_04475 [Acidobacterium sp.]|uniref:Uncharacterized protein n=1 Tax=Acidobacterium capsulatum (strain ATCC 51196 / DSM 11244 / BCRC 80197 / JCM 7670 / NBRC 15755 / NCIMB 13165 / 161) TaxID=240015 RepID=C1F2X8_ACIC5|nr:hypothetical protein ACP_0879 [Acidobacterium capsulatum ATCC 51196]HCT60118.1 hypothetical protein [Acidobacterium sp.]